MRLNRITLPSQPNTTQLQANVNEKLARDREEKFASEQEALSRKTKLNEQIKKCAEDEKRVSPCVYAMLHQVCFADDCGSCKSS